MVAVPKPTLGRIVYYSHKLELDSNGEPKVSAGIITRVYGDLEDSCDLRVFTSYGEFVAIGVKRSGSGANSKGTWRWPDTVH